ARRATHLQSRRSVATHPSGGLMRAVIRALAVLLAVATWADLLINVVWPTMAGGRFPTSAYWVAPRLVIDGRVDVLWDTTRFAEAALGLGANSDLWVHPPIAVLPLLPLGLLDQGPSYVLFVALNFSALVAAVVLLWVALRPPLTIGLI